MENKPKTDKFEEILTNYQVTNQTLSELPPLPIEECNRFGYERKMYDEDKVAYCDELNEQEIKRDQLRIQKFAVMKQLYETKHIFHKKMKDRVRKGLPHEVRKEFYEMILDHYKNSVSMDFLPNINELYHKNEVLPNDNQIDLDVKRTQCSHYLFNTNYVKGKRELFLLLRAISQIETELGYTQGMNDFGGLIFSVTHDKTITLQLFHFILNNPMYDMKENVKDMFPGLKDYEKVHNLMMKHLHPNIWNHFMKLGYNDVPMPSFLFEWYMMWFCRILPVDMCYYVFYRMLFDGRKALFTAAHCLLTYLEEDILKETEIFLAIQIMKTPIEIVLRKLSGREFMNYCYKNKVTQKMINSWLSEENSN